MNLKLKTAIYLENVQYVNHLWSSDKLFRYGDFLSEKNIVGPQEGQYPQFLLQLPLTHYILRSTFFRTPPTPPICLKMPICAIFSTFWESHLKYTPKVGVHREKFNIGNVAQIFFGGFYICWHYVISFSQHFPMKNFSPSPSTSPSPESGGFFEIWLKNVKYYFWGGKIKI